MPAPLKRRKMIWMLTASCALGVGLAHGRFWPVAAQGGTDNQGASGEKAVPDKGDDLKLNRRGGPHRDQPVNPDAKDVPSVSPEASRDLVRTLTGSGESRK